jgi:hypothetical protein
VLKFTRDFSAVFDENVLQRRTVFTGKSDIVQRRRHLLVRTVNVPADTHISCKRCVMFGGYVTERPKQLEVENFVV